VDFVVIRHFIQSRLYRQICQVSVRLVSLNNEGHLIMPSPGLVISKIWLVWAAIVVVWPLHVRYQKQFLRQII
jgi:hypothetical protein